MSEALRATPASAVVPISPSDRLHDSVFVFLKDGKRIGVIASDEVFGDQKWLEEAAKNAQRVVETHRIERAVLIARIRNGAVPDSLPGTNVPVVVDLHPIRAANRATERLTG